MSEVGFMKMEHEVMAVFALTILFMFGNWLLDVGHVVVFSSMMYSNMLGFNITPLLGNGYWVFPAMATYHTGWYLSLISHFLQAFFCIHIIMKYSVCKGRAHTSKAG